jgi:hypothetical protein
MGNIGVVEESESSNDVFERLHEEKEEKEHRIEENIKMDRLLAEDAEANAIKPGSSNKFEEEADREELEDEIKHERSDPMNMRFKYRH